MNAIAAVGADRAVDIVKAVIGLVFLAAMFGTGFFWGKVVQSRRSIRWASENPTEVYRLAEELESLSCGRRSSPPRADPSGRVSATGAARAQIESMSAMSFTLLRSGIRGWSGSGADYRAKSTSSC